MESSAAFPLRHSHSPYTFPSHTLPAPTANLPQSLLPPPTSERKFSGNPLPSNSSGPCPGQPGGAVQNQSPIRLAFIAFPEPISISSAPRFHDRDSGHGLRRVSGRRQGFHTHELAFIPPERAVAFRVGTPTGTSPPAGALRRQMFSDCSVKAISSCRACSSACARAQSCSARHSSK